MEVILCQDVDKLGKVGEIVKVKPGFARNYLIPRKLAYLATPTNLKRIELEKAKKLELDRKDQQEAQQLAERLSKVSCTVPVEVNDLDKLYGSVSESDIAQALEQEGYKIDRKNIIMDKPIDVLGIYDVGIRLHREVVAKVRIWVTKK